MLLTALALAVLAGGPAGSLSGVGPEKAQAGSHCYLGSLTIFNRINVKCAKARRVLSIFLHDDPLPGAWYCNHIQSICIINQKGPAGKEFQWR